MDYCHIAILGGQVNWCTTILHVLMDEEGRKERRRWELMCGVEEKEGRKPAEGMTG